MDASRGFEVIVAPAEGNNPRNSEAAIIELTDGRLLLGWTEFYESSGADHAPARLVGRVSADRGKTWGTKYTLVENDGGCNVMEVNFLRLRDGRIALFHGQKNTELTDCRIVMRTSSDEGKTFRSEKQLSPEGAYTGLTNGRGLRLSTGRILIEVWEGETCYCCLSDDDGETWRDSRRIRPADGGCWENACVELKDGRVLMLMRTGLGGQYKSVSADGGESWSSPEPPPQLGTAAPVSISRIPATGDLLAIWNNNPDTYATNNTNRNPLTSSVSEDEGERWTHFRDLEEAPDDAWAYPAVTWVDDCALVTYFTYKGGHSLKLRGIPLDWFYFRTGA